MAQRRVKLAFIENNAERKASYEKRMKGFTKQIKDLSTRCDVEACAIVYGLYQEQPQIWPEEPRDVNEVLKKFMKIPATTRTKRMMNQEGVMSQRIEKLKKQLNKLKQLNRGNEVAGFVRGILEGSIQLGNLSLSDKKDVNEKLLNKLEEINKRMDFLGKQALQSEPAPEPESVSDRHGTTNAVGDCGKYNSD